MLVSIVIPVFNQMEYLNQAMESALNQDLKDILPDDSVSIEVIVVDDKSTDRSLRIAQDYWKRIEDKRLQQVQATFDWCRENSWPREKIEAAIAELRNPIKIVEQPQNMGLPFARNAGINATLSKNGYDMILPLDADDWIEPDYLKKTVPLMMGDRVGVVGTWARCFGIKDYIWHTKSPQIEQLMRDNCVPVCSLIKRGALEATGNYYNRQLNSGYEDWNLWIDILKRGWKIEILPEPLFHYREKEKSMLKEATTRRPELVAKIHSLHPDLWPPEGRHNMLNKWAGHRDATGANEAGFYGIEETYKKAAQFLDDGPVEDWGCGKAYSKRFFSHSYKGVDGTPDGCDAVVDLARYTSNTHGILLRHVLEHNFDWEQILKNALASGEKLAIIVCTEFSDQTHLLYIDQFGIPIFSFKKEDLVKHFPSYTEEVVTGEGQGQQCSETIFYVRTK
jgi:glycosyltransferase involved in cell wall biosynthesis